MTLASSGIEIDAPLVLAATQTASPSLSKNSRFATIDPAYSGVGNPRIMFDGELVLSQKTYQFIGARPIAGDRVVMEPMADTWVITGSLTTPTSPKFVQVWSMANATVTLTSAPTVILAQMPLPDPGWPYKLCAIGQAYYQTGSIYNQYYLRARLDNPDGVRASRYGTGVTVGYGLGPRQSLSMPSEYDNPVLQGSHTLYLVIWEAAASDPVEVPQASSYGGLFVLQIPVAG
jgi:hypothetical protein